MPPGPYGGAAKRGHAETLAYYRREVQKGLDDPVTIEGEEAFKMLDEVIASLKSKQ